LSFGPLFLGLDKREEELGTMFDLLIKNAKVLDGLGSEERVADVGVKGDTIEAVGDLAVSEAERVIDAEELHAAPGFIDMHTHSGFLFPINPKAESKVHQGVTTEVIGHCGTSIAPLRGDALREAETLTKMIGLDIDWETFDGYNDKVLGQGVAVNIVHLLGHGTMRDAVMGRTDREPTDEEIKQMHAEIDSAFEQGVFGMSTGLIYPPGCYAKTDELIELSKAVFRNGGLYSSHIRGDRDRRMRRRSRPNKSPQGCGAEILGFGLGGAWADRQGARDGDGHHRRSVSVSRGSHRTVGHSPEMGPQRRGAGTDRTA